MQRERERARETLIPRLKSLIKRLRGDLVWKENVRILQTNADYLAGLIKITEAAQTKNLPRATGDLRLHQMASVALLKRFTDFLDKHEIPYWLSFGTLLGAVRHGGFVPWDDDLDIAMLRRDYERLKKIIHLWRKEEQWFFNFKFFQIYYGDTRLNLDIFPFSQGDTVEVPTGEKLEKISRKMGKRYAFSQLKHQARCDERGREKWDCVPESFDEEELVGYFNREILENRTPLENGYLVLPLWGDVDELRYCIPYNKIFPLSKITFEGVEFSCPRNIDFALRGFYGDYWQLPKNVPGNLGFQKHEGLLPEDGLNPKQAQDLRDLASELTHWDESDRVFLEIAHDRN